MLRRGGGRSTVLERPIEGKPSRRFPEKSDLIKSLVDQGLVANEADLLQRRPDLVGDLMLNWIQHSQTSCRFATHLAKHRREAGWHTIVMPRRLETAQFRAAIDSVLDPPPDGAEMIMFIFPWVTKPEDLADLIAQLGACSGWSWAHPISFDVVGPDQCLVGLRWLLPSGESESWVLGFAPFDFMPFTRRSPYAAIVMRPTDPSQVDRPPEGLAPVHLAQVPHFFGARGVRDGEIWKLTEEQRRDFLGGELTHVAKARVSFALPVGLADRATPGASSR
jgi:hypothetical protein